MTAVICWSMKMRMVARRAGAMAAGTVHHGLVNGSTNQPLPSHVGLKSPGTSSLGVCTPAHTSTPVIMQMVMKTAKSLIN